MAQAIEAAVSEVAQKGKQREHKSELLPVPGPPDESAHAAEQHQPIPQGDTQEGCIRGPQQKLLSQEQSSDAQQSSTGESQPKQAGPQPSAFSRAGRRALALRRRGLVSGPQALTALLSLLLLQPLSTRIKPPRQ